MRRSEFYDKSERTLDGIIGVAGDCKEQVRGARERTPEGALAERASEEEQDQLIRLDFVLRFMRKEGEAMGAVYVGAE